MTRFRTMIQEQHMPMIQRVVGASSALLLLVGTAGAQGVPADRAPAVVAAPTASLAVKPLPARLAAPVEAPALVVAEDRAEAARAAVAVATMRARGQGSTLMIVGGAGIVTGLLLDESVITFVGAAVWLYGLYVYLR
jgi:hypothetical protein